MKTVPPEILDPKSAAEQRLHKMIRQIRFGEGDIALHSLNLAIHDYKKWSEADFVLITRLGILLIEVKGGRVACRDGVWEFTNRFGEGTRKHESPASQAKSAFFSLEQNYLRPRFRDELKGITMGWAVVFEGIDEIAGGSSGALLAEQPHEITAYRKDCVGHNSFAVFLERVFEYWKGHAKGSKRELSPKQISEVAQFLRPNFEKVPPLNSQLFEFNQELCEFTDEQCIRMDEIQENDRIVVRGGAGTGKTFLAIACARYEAASGQRVIIVTRSPFLAKFISSHHLDPNITVSCFDELPFASGQVLWDVMIVDEGQDLCQLAALDKLSQALRGGLEGGRWRWFGDPNNQISSHYTFENDAYAYLQSVAFKQRLAENIRNAPPIIKAIHEFAPLDLGRPRARGIGSEVQYQIARSRGDLVQTTVSMVARWIAAPSEAARSQIAVLTGLPDLIPIIANALGSRGIRAEPLTVRALSAQPRDCVLVSSIEAFKGLERPLVCLCGVDTSKGDEDSLRQLYGAFSRANHTLSVVCTETDMENIEHLRQQTIRAMNA